MIRCDELLYINELPEELQEKAVCSWLDGRRAMIIRRIRAHKASARRNIHATINYKYHIYGYFKDLRTIKRLRENENERENALLDDAPLFSEEGDFYLFPRKMFTSQLLEKLGLVATVLSPDNARFLPADTFSNNDYARKIAQTGNNRRPDIL